MSKAREFSRYPRVASISLSLSLSILDRNLFGERGRFNDVTGHGADHRIARHDTATISDRQLYGTNFHVAHLESNHFTTKKDIEDIGTR